MTQELAPDSPESLDELLRDQRAVARYGAFHSLVEWVFSQLNLEDKEAMMSFLVENIGTTTVTPDTWDAFIELSKDYARAVLERDEWKARAEQLQVKVVNLAREADYYRQFTTDNQ